MAAYPASVSYAPQAPMQTSDDALPPPHLTMDTRSFPYDAQSLKYEPHTTQDPMPYPAQPLHPQHDDTSPQHAPGSAAGPSGAGGESQKAVRLRKACDSCSVRKVKCDESGPPCRACAALDIPCTFERPSRRRGPPNRHAEAIRNQHAIKKRRLEDSDPAVGESPISPNNVAATLASFSSHAVLSAESICPMPLLELLVNDFFTYIHPLCPFPHEPSFRGAFRGREDLNNPCFLALLASMVGILVASFPRRPKLHLKAQQRENLFPSSMSLVERCHKVAVEARGPGYLDKSTTVYDAATSYFLGLSGAYTFNWKQCRLYFGETLTLVRILGAHRSKESDTLSLGDLPQYYGARDGAAPYSSSEPVDYIKQEIGRRIFWVMFVGIRSMQQLGASFGELVIPPPTPRDPYPPLPLEVDDEHIYVNQIMPQPAGIVSKMTGFNLNISIYKTTTPLHTMEMAYGIDEVFDFARQKIVLAECLRSVKRVLDNNPPELTLQPGSQPGRFASPPEWRYQGAPEYTEHPGGHEQASWSPSAPDERRKLQYEIQKANIYASQLGTRSYIVEKWWNLQDAYAVSKASTGQSPQLRSPGVMASGLDGMLPKGPTSGFDGVAADIAIERESVVKDLLKVLHCISQVNMEPNGGSFAHKIRQIASTLVDTPDNRKGPFAQRAQEYLGQFLDILMKLERFSPSSLPGEADSDDEEQLRHWADLREYQIRFAQAGGFLSELLSA